MSAFLSIIKPNVFQLLSMYLLFSRKHLLPRDTSCWDMIHTEEKAIVCIIHIRNCSHNKNDDISLPLYMLFRYETIIPGIIVQCTNDDGKIFQGTNVQGASVSVSAVVCGDFHPELECLLVQLLLLLLFLLLLRNASQSFTFLTLLPRCKTVQSLHFQSVHFSLSLHYANSVILLYSRIHHNNIQAIYMFD
jgi:hypothetical protein